MTKQKLPIGTSDFRQLRQEGLYYVDKSLLAEEIMEDTSRVILLPRPRRFGKTLNLSMLRYFFDVVEDNSELFEDSGGAPLAITQSPAWAHQGKYPVLYITLKGCKGIDWAGMQHQLAKAISAMVKPHQYLLENEALWVVEDPDEFRALLRGNASLHTMQDSLLLLTQLLEEHHGTKPVLLIDEYDTPLIEAYNKGYYTEARNAMQVLLGDGLKDNTALGKAVVTGILRVAKESLFSGLNNITVANVLDYAYADKFGLTQAEVETAMELFGLGEQIDAVNEWYNGYRFGDYQIFNPWSILNYLQNPRQGFMPYWVNTSDNALIIEQLENALPSTITRIEALMQGRPVNSLLEDHTVFKDLEHPGAVTLFTFLTFSGYLNASFAFQEITERYFTLEIPNLEVLSVYQTIFKRYFQKTLDTQPAQELLNGLLNGDFDLFERYLKGYVLQAFSFFDLPASAPEKIYHAFMMGTLGFLHTTHKITSNREVGLGRADMLIVPKDAKDLRGYVLEFKRAESPEDLDSTAQEALNQIEQRQYTADLLAEGRQVYSLGIAFCGKQVKVLHAVLG